MEGLRVGALEFPPWCKDGDIRESHRDHSLLGIAQWLQASKGQHAMLVGVGCSKRRLCGFGTHSCPIYSLTGPNCSHGMTLLAYRLTCASISVDWRFGDSDLSQRNLISPRQKTRQSRLDQPNLAQVHAERLRLVPTP